MSVLEPQGFWDEFRRELALAFKKEPRALDDTTVKLTPVVTRAAETVCEKLGPSVVIRSRYRGGEEQVSWNCPVRCRAISPSGLDVSARLPGDARRAIAFESELAPLGWKKRTYLKTWIEEFVKLCCVDAKLRVLSSYFLPGESPTFVETLHMVFRRFKPMVDSATPGKWLLVFGSFESSREPSVPWLPFAWETGAGPSDVALRPLTGVLRPRRIASGEDDPGAC